MPTTLQRQGRQVWLWPVQEVSKAPGRPSQAGMLGDRNRKLRQGKSWCDGEAKQPLLEALCWQMHASRHTCACCASRDPPPRTMGRTLYAQPTLADTKGVCGM